MKARWVGMAATWAAYIGCSDGSSLRGEVGRFVLPGHASKPTSTPAPRPAAELEPALPPALIAGANLTFDCAIVDRVRGDDLSTLECAFFLPDGTIFDGDVSFAKSGLEVGGAAAPLQTALRSETGGGLVLILTGLPLGQFASGVVTVEAWVNGEPAPQRVDLAPREADARAEDRLPVNLTPTPTAAPTPDPTAAPTPDPTAAPTPLSPATPPRMSLFGQWAGLCGHDKGSSTCNLMQSGMATSQGICQSGFSFYHVASRYQGAMEDSALASRFMGACLRAEPGDAAQLAQQQASPASYVVAGGWYGLCVYKVTWNPLTGKDKESPSCDKALVAPMRSDKTCPAGFTYRHVAAQHNEKDGYWVSTCVADAEGSQVGTPPAGSPVGLCAYVEADGPGAVCSKALVAPAVSRGSCGALMFAPFAGRFGGRTEQWAGTCLTQ